PVDHRLLGLLTRVVVVAIGEGALAGAGAFDRLADPRVGQRLFAVEGVRPLMQAQGDAALATAGAAGDVGAELVGDGYFDPADRVDQLFEAGEVDDRDVVNLDPEELFDRLYLQGGAAVSVSGVDFGRRVAGDFGVGVARDRKFVEGAAAGADQHQGVGAEFAFVAGLVRLLALRLLFEALLGGVAIAGAGWSRVGAEDKDRLRARQQERVAVQGLAGFAGELEGLDLGGDAEGDEADQDPGEGGEADPFEHPPRRDPAALGRWHP